MTNPTPPDDDLDYAESRWRLGPRIWGPVAGFLGVAAVALGLMVALGVNGDTKVVHDFRTCQIGTPGCENRPAVHEHADFALFINGKQFDFGQPQFISHEGDPRSEEVHIHDPRHTVLHLHRASTSWYVFFQTLGFTLTDKSLPGTTNDKVCLKMPDGTNYCNDATNTWKFFMNGVQVDGLTVQYIHDLERALFSYGPETADEVRAQQVPKVTDQACIPSEICTARIDPNEPVENCSKSSRTCQ